MSRLPTATVHALQTLLAQPQTTFSVKNTSSAFHSKITPCAGHSLGPASLPALNGILNIFRKQYDATQAWSEENEKALMAAQKLLGFENPDEFCFTETGLSENLSMMVNTFLRITKEEWETGKNKIVMLASDFYSDQAILMSAMERQIQSAVMHGIFTDDNRPKPEDCFILLRPNENGIYETQEIMDAIRWNAEKIKLIHLSDIVFNTGQRLKIEKIFSSLRKKINDNQIIIGLDLAHSFGNYPIDLKNMPVMIYYAVMCGYKYLSGPAGSAAGIYVNRKIDFTKFPTMHGAQATASGAAAFDLTHPLPIAIAATKANLEFLETADINDLIKKSQTLTAYLLVKLQAQLGDQIEIITPTLDSAEHGATIVFRVKGISDANEIEKKLRESETPFEIDVRGSNIRITAHYAYTTFLDIENVTFLLKKIIADIQNPSSINPDKISAPTQNKPPKLLALLEGESSAAYFFDSLQTVCESANAVISANDVKTKTAKELDDKDPLTALHAFFSYTKNSEQPIFLPGLNKIIDVFRIQYNQLHGGHFPDSHPQKEDHDHWFECNQNKPAMEIAQEFLGFAHPDEFRFTAKGRIQTLAMLLDTFTRITQEEWRSGKIKIMVLQSDFEANKDLFLSIMKREIQTAIDHGVFHADHAPKPEDCFLYIKPDKNGHYDSAKIIDAITKNQKKIRHIHLPRYTQESQQLIRFEEIFSPEIKKIVQKNNMVVGLEIPHALTDHPLNLQDIGVITYAITSSDEYLCQNVGNTSGFYVNANADLKKFPPSQGWTVPGTDVFKTISQYDPKIMQKKGAAAFSLSNPPPVPLAYSQTLLKLAHVIGREHCANKSKRLTQYLLLQLKKQLGEHLQLITPDDSAKHGASIVFRIHGIADASSIVNTVKKQLSKPFDITASGACIIITPHFACDKFSDIQQVTYALKTAVKNILVKNKQNEYCGDGNRYALFAKMSEDKIRARLNFVNQRSPVCR